MTWKKYEPVSWTYEKVDDFVEGILVSIEDNKNYEGKKIYHLEQEDGTQMNVWGTTVLDSKMLGLKPGDRIKIIYKGSKENKGKNATKLFEVYRDDNFEPEILTAN